MDKERRYRVRFVNTRIPITTIPFIIPATPGEIGALVAFMSESGISMEICPALENPANAEPEPE